MPPAAAAASLAVAFGPRDVQRSDPTRLRNATGRASENEPQHTRDAARHRFKTAASASTTRSSLGSMLTLTSGHVVRMSSSSGIGSPPPPTFAPLMSDQRRSEIAPVMSVTRSRWSSWNATTTSSAVRCTSVSR